jgi:DNA-binding LytR/AlgR family response regulator
MLKPFFVRYEKVLKRIDPEKVICLSTKKNYTYIYLTDKIYYMVRTSLSAAVKKLPPDMFIRIDRSLVVSIYFIDNIARDHLLIAGEPANIGKKYYSTVIKKLNIIE